MQRQFLNIDNMDKDKGMPYYPDKYFDLAIVDPPYGKDCDIQRGDYGGKNNRWNNKKWNGKIEIWNKSPDKKYFDELFRISKDQIIWGGNYFSENLKSSSGWIVWDKGQRDFSLADGEMAWTSFNIAMRIFSYSRAQSNRNSKSNHPNEKPIDLYKWILKNYAKEGMKILDTHVGSASSLIAFEEFGIDYVGYELDKEYYDSACKRIENYRSQGKLFEPGFDQ
jgi:site-specific DNA-methyltransferase (adenine-specific)